ncbi:TMEM175 family protein [Geodermatophilus sp. CPCC 206100]|uniref:TMEM175 family protein n=1 Tax=Geodermatophilus sp. CPCC 206100 TaxID=3020054 RepID=UPI003AFFAB72
MRLRATEPPASRGATAETGRVEAFSDGVLAIVITLLVLELHPPSEPGAMLTELGEQWPGYLAYLASFGYVAVIWVNHHELFTRIAAVDVGLLWRNLALLLTTSFLPFPTAVLGTAFQHGTRADQAAALVLYCALAAAMAISWLALFQHLCHRPRLLRTGTPADFFAAERGRALLGVAAYAVAAGSAAWQPLLGLGIAAVLPVFYALTSRGWHSRRAATGAGAEAPADH